MDLPLDLYYDRFPNATLGSELYNFRRCKRCKSLVADIKDDLVGHIDAHTEQERA